MSRWDALKPTSEQRGWKSHPQRVHRQKKQGTVATTPRVSAQQSRKRDDERDNASNQDTRTDRCEKQHEIRLLKARYAAIVREFSVSGHNDSVVNACELCELVVRLRESIPMEEVANTALAQIILPTLANGSVDVKLKCTIIDQLSTLLCDKKFESAILAPLVSGVSEQGKERQLPNPVRLQLFKLMQLLLVQEDAKMSNMLRSSCCTFLTKTLRAAKSLEGTCHHAGQSATDVDGGMIRGIVERSLKSPVHGRQHLVLLRLLLAFLNRHPESCATFIECCLMPSNQKRQPDTIIQCNCGFAPGSNAFLGVLHTSVDVELLQTSLDIAKVLLAHLPLQKWISEDFKTKFQTSRFRSELKEALDCLADICKCIWGRPSTQNVIELRNLTTTLLRRYPVAHNRLSISVSSLLAKLSMLLLDSDTDGQPAVFEVWNSTSGGQVTPQGQLVPMACSLRLWLERKAGQSFTTILLTSVGENSMYSDVLSAMVLTQPGIILRNEENLNLLLAMLEERSVFSAKHLALISSLLRGRHDFDREFLFYPTALIKVSGYLKHTVTVNSISSSDKLVACSSYGSFLDCDWSIVATEPGMCAAHLLPLVSLCTSKEIAARTRSGICKCIGDICSNYFAEIHSATETSDIAKSIGRAMLENIHHSNGNVRCMALFAIGNLAQQLLLLRWDDEFSPCWIETASPCWIETAQMCIALTSDTEEKVASNAIRALGHMTSFILRHRLKLGFDVDQFWFEVLRTLAEKVRNVHNFETFPLGHSLTWKQRSALKRQGWGACYAFKTILASEPLKVFQESPPFQIMVTILLEIVANVANGSEKVSVAAMSALRSIDAQHLGGMDTKVLGNVAWACREFLAKEREPSSERLRLEVELTLVTLLNAFTIADAKVFLTHEMDPYLDDLFHWMVEKGCQVSAFESLAIAMSSKSTCGVDAIVEQLFGSHVLRLMGQQEDIGEEL